MSTLNRIRQRTRLLTGRLSEQALTTVQLDEYINDFYLYELPSNLWLFSLHTTFEFLTIANVGEYNLLEMPVTLDGVTQPAGEVYTNLNPPAYISGYESYWTQNVDEFFNIYPRLGNEETSLLGDGSVGPYTTTISHTPIQQNTFTIGVLDSSGTNIQLVDDPQSAQTGTFRVINDETIVTGSINYLTGALSVTFPTSIPAGNEIFITWVPYTASRPRALLFYDNILQVRPIPDGAYKVQVNAFRTPTQLMEANDTPLLKQWANYLSYGAAKNIFEDSMDPDSLAIIMPQYLEYESQVLRRTLVQQSNQRVPTIYSEVGNYPYGGLYSQF